jgi:hypothetical protein
MPLIISHLVGLHILLIMLVSLVLPILLLSGTDSFPLLRPSPLWLLLIIGIVPYLILESITMPHSCQRRQVGAPLIPCMVGIALHVLHYEYKLIKININLNVNQLEDVVLELLLQL